MRLRLGIGGRAFGVRGGISHPWDRRTSRASAGALCLGQGSRDVFQVGSDLG